MKFVVKMLQACFLHSFFFNSSFWFSPARILNISPAQWKIIHLFYFFPYLPLPPFISTLAPKPAGDIPASGSNPARRVRDRGDLNITEESRDANKKSCLQPLIQEEMDESTVIINYYPDRGALAACFFFWQEEKTWKSLLRRKTSEESDAWCNTFLQLQALTSVRNSYISTGCDKVWAKASLNLVLWV